MSSEIEVRPQASAPALSSGTAEWADELMAWAAAAQKAHEIATVLCETSFVPKSMAHKPGDVTGAILMSMELNVPVMWGLSNIDIIDGTPGIRAKALRALAFRRGHEVWVEESTATRAIVCARRKGSQRIERSKWDMDRAKRANLLGKKNWREYQQDMLVSRATAEALRLAAPDDLLGGMYTVDELGGEEELNEPIAADAASPPAKRRTAHRSKPEPEPPRVAPEDLPTDIPTPGTGETLASTCDVNMPHDMRYGAPAGCPPNCPTRRPAEPPPIVVPDEATAIATLETAGFEVVDVIDTLDSPDDAEPAADPAEEKMTDPQRRRMAVEMRNAGLVQRAERLDFAAETIGRPIETSSELTVVEASKVIDRLVSLNEETEHGLAAAERAAAGEGEEE